MLHTLLAEFWCFFVEAVFPILYSVRQAASDIFSQKRNGFQKHCPILATKYSCFSEKQNHLPENKNQLGNEVNTKTLLLSRASPFVYKAKTVYCES